jgi:hypothetical protein
MESRYQEFGVCGLSCRLCPHFHTVGESRCTGCRGEVRMGAGCALVTCAVKRRGIEFCWECDESETCERWARHREHGRSHDTFVSYASLEDNIETVARLGLDAFIAGQLEREGLLLEMLGEFNEGRSKSYYCIAATVLDPSELRSAIDAARESTAGADVRERAKALHASLDAAARARGRSLVLRK